LVAWLLANRGYGNTSAPAPAPPPGTASPTLLIISMDGFRANFMQSHAQYLPNIRAFFSDGVKTSGLRPSFPSLTFPNHYTIATGLYPSAHGIVANSFIDPVTTAKFSMGSGSLEAWWWGGEPLWVTARKAGLNAYVYFWPGSEVELHGVRPTQYKA
jgi:predicted AlkP superfamily pyrophosphatase or phosphodiesterase